jgi:chitodextrinase
LHRPRAATLTAAVTAAAVLTTTAVGVAASADHGPKAAAAAKAKAKHRKAKRLKQRAATRRVRAAAAGAPVSTSRPWQGGYALVGQSIIGNNGTWNPTGTYRYSFQRCDAQGANCSVVVRGVTTYPVTSADRGSTIRFRVVARNAYGSTEAVSWPSTVVPGTAPTPTTTTPTPPPPTTTTTTPTPPPPTTTTTTPTPPPPPADTTAPSVPTGLAATAGNAQVSLAWNASTDNVGVTGYRILRNGTQVGTTSSGTRTYTDTGLTNGTAYSYTVRAVDAAGNVSAASAAVSATPQAPAPPPSAGPEVRTATELLSAIKNAANSGKTITVRAGTYGDLDLKNVQQAALTTLKAAAGEQPVFGYTQMQGTRNVRIEGMRFSSSLDIQPSSSSNHGSNIQIVGNEFTGFKYNAIAVREFNDNILIQDNFIHDLVDETTTDMGYGITLHGSYGPIDGATVRGNRILRIPNDGLQTSGVRSLVVDRNEFSYIAWPTLSGSKHPDIIQIMGAYAPGPVITNNNFHHNSQPVFIQDGIPAGRIENNLIHDIKNYGISIGDAGTSNGSGISGWVMRRNTVWNTGLDFGGGMGVLWRGNGVNNVLEGNVLHNLTGRRLSIGSGGQFASAAGNVIPNGTTIGATDVRTAPVFDADFQATNVDAGFRK